MSELLFMAHDHTAEAGLSTGQLAALPALYDLIVAWEDGEAVWGTDDLTSPRFRILHWVGQPLAEFTSFLVPLPPELDADLQPVTYEQYRGFYLDLAALQLPEVRNWFADDVRAAPKLIFDDPNVTPDSLSRARPPIPIS
jgi:hypothetical protein